MKKMNIVMGLIVTLLIMASICFFYVFIGPEFEISITQSWGRVTRETTEIKTVIAVNNPTLISRLLKRIEFDLYINDLKIASEVSENIVEAKPRQKTEISLTSFLNNSKILDLWVAYISNGNNFCVRLDGNVTFKSMLRELICPIGYNTTAHTNLLEPLSTENPKDFRVGPATLTLKSLNLTWGEATLNQTEINTEADIYNPNSYPITITQINNMIEMNSITVVEGAINTSIALEAKKDSNASFTAILNTTMLDEWWATHLRNDQVTRIAVKLKGVAEIVGTEYSFPIVEGWEDASIRILGGTIAYGFYLPVL